MVLGLIAVGLTAAELTEIAITTAVTTAVSVAVSKAIEASDNDDE